ncbi:MAG: hypothetical protein K2K07_03490, partial [Lachnospiraceae bacterium]|nr:hypothetical protein [Lachnospiraceae bacterium]
MKKNRRRMVTTILLTALCVTTGCSNELPEDELVGNGQAFEMQKISDDLQASNFPFQDKEKFVTLT